MGTVTASAQSSDTVKVKWSASNKSSKNWRIYYRETAFGQTTWPNWKDVTSSSKVNSDSATVSGLKPDTKYRFKVNKIKSNGKKGARVGEDHATTLQAVSAGSGGGGGTAADSRVLFLTSLMTSAMKEPVGKSEVSFAACCEDTVGNTEVFGSAPAVKVSGDQVKGWNTSPVLAPHAQVTEQNGRICPWGPEDKVHLLFYERDGKPSWKNGATTYTFPGTNREFKYVSVKGQLKLNVGGQWN